MSSDDRIRRNDLALTIVQGSPDHAVVYEFLALYLKYGKKIVGNIMTEAVYQLCKKKEMLGRRMSLRTFSSEQIEDMNEEYLLLDNVLRCANMGISSSHLPRNVCEWYGEIMAISSQPPFVVYETAVPVWVPLSTEPVDDLPHEVEIIGPDA